MYTVVMGSATLPNLASAKLLTVRNLPKDKVAINNPTVQTPLEHNPLPYLAGEPHSNIL